MTNRHSSVEIIKEKPYNVPGIISENKMCFSLRLITQLSESVLNSGHCIKWVTKTFRDFKYEASDVITSNIASCTFFSWLFSLSKINIYN